MIKSRYDKLSQVRQAFCVFFAKFLQNYLGNDIESESFLTELVENWTKSKGTVRDH